MVVELAVGVSGFALWMKEADARGHVHQMPAPIGNARQTCDVVS
jgi:hypothetical protein